MVPLQPYALLQAAGRRVSVSFIKEDFVGAFNTLPIRLSHQ
jgi:hypothetical protein